MLPNKNELAEQVRVLMAEKKISGKELAKKLKITPTTVSAMRRGDSSWSLYVRAIKYLEDIK